MHEPIIMRELRKRKWKQERIKLSMAEVATSVSSRQARRILSLRLGLVLSSGLSHKNSLVD